MEEDLRKALTEVDKILENTDEELVKKIPDNFKNYIKENKDENYVFEVDTEKGLLEQEDLSYKTKAILSLIYRDYFCSKEEREELLREEREEKLREEEEKRKRYNPDDLFKKEEKPEPIQKEEEQKNTALVEYSELKWYQKIYQKILKFFKIR